MIWSWAAVNETTSNPCCWRCISPSSSDDSDNQDGSEILAAGEIKPPVCMRAKLLLYSLMSVVSVKWLILSSIMWQSVLFILLLPSIESFLPFATSTQSEAFGSEDTATSDSTVVSVMAVVPSTPEQGEIEKSVLLPRWKVGEEILPGAQLAVKEINNCSSLLCHHRLKLVPIMVPYCDVMQCWSGSFCEGVNG